MGLERRGQGLRGSRLPPESSAVGSGRACSPRTAEPSPRALGRLAWCPVPTPASEDSSESEGSESSGRSCRNEHSVREKLQVLMAEGLLPAVKVFLDWLRTNPDLIIVCAQVGRSGPCPWAGASGRAAAGKVCPGRQFWPHCSALGPPSLQEEQA